MPVNRATLRDLIGAIIQRLLDKGVVANRQQILVVSKRKNPDHANPLAEILIRVGRKKGDWDTPGGRWAFKKIVSIGIYVRCSSMLDKGLTDEEWLYTIDALEDKVYDALLDWLPLDKDENAWTTEAMHVIENMEPIKDQEDVWGEAMITFEAHYQPAGVDPTDLG